MLHRQPPNVHFFDMHWKPIGTRYQLRDEISSITGIDTSLVAAPRLGIGIDYKTRAKSFSVAARMPWASRCETTRPKDPAYCLLGPFNVNMPLLYGEGGEGAFVRPQEEIAKSTCDQSILVYNDLTITPILPIFLYIYNCR